MSEITDLIQAREQTRRFLVAHERSIWHFWDDVEGVFFRTERDRAIAEDAPERHAPVQPQVHRLTSTITCLESLIESPDWEHDKKFGSADRPNEILRQFLAGALADDGSRWKSDNAAWVYCRVRTLASSLRLLGPTAHWTGPERDSICSLISWAWQSHESAGGSFGLREATEFPSTAEKLGAQASSEQYPPNAFLTYWGLLAAQMADGSDITPPVQVADQRAAIAWLRENLGVQVSFHYERSAHADPQQLAYSICGLVRFGDGSALANRTSVEHELLSAGVRAFFEQQRDDGTWAVGAPLFHYQSAGNAYAYSYETLGELLALACSSDLTNQAAEALRDVLHGYSAELWKAYEYAERSSQHLGGGSYGWSSGHHAHRNTAEGWATGSVFRFMQGLRRLLGMWSSAAAKSALGSRQPAMALADLRGRGGSWDLGSGTAGALLATTFLHPAARSMDRVNADGRFPMDPDNPLLGGEQAVSAVLFGPPGTGKTSMVEAIAGSLNWDFVEITPAQFLDAGVDFVSKRADEIFRLVMETDRCVILLDEIDELIQQRTGAADPLSRFFTTTMLPRLAKLWNSRRVLFFVNTNDITRVDSAIIRSQRFDAGLFILPAGYQTKFQLLQEVGLDLQVDADSVRKAILEENQSSTAERPIGWLALVRYDQINALAADLKASAAGGVVDREALVAGVDEIAGEMRHLDWRDAANGEDSSSNDIPTTDEVFARVKKQFEFRRFDPRVQLWAKLATESGPVASGLLVEQTSSANWVHIGGLQSPEAWATKFGGSITPDGIVVFPLEAEPAAEV